LAGGMRGPAIQQKSAARNKARRERGSPLSALQLKKGVRKNANNGDDLKKGWSWQRKRDVEGFAGKADVKDKEEEGV